MPTDFIGDNFGESTDAEDTDGTVDIDSAANDPQSISVDGVSVTERSLKDKIDADRHLSARNPNSGNAPFGPKFARINPGDAV